MLIQTAILITVLIAASIGREPLSVAVVPRRLAEFALEGAHETGGMFVSDDIRDLFDGHRAEEQQLRCLVQAAFAEQLPQVSAAAFLLEQTLQVIGAQACLTREALNGYGRLGLDNVQDSANAGVPHRRHQLVGGWPVATRYPLVRR